MTSPLAAPAPSVSLASQSLTLAQRIAERLPERAGTAWTAEPHQAWWSTVPAARLVQGERALIVVSRAWDTQIGWQLPDRTPRAPDFTIQRMAPEPVAEFLLRLVLPVLDDEAARPRTDAPRVPSRLELCAEIGNAVRAQGSATYERPGFLPNSHTVTWTSDRVRYSVTLHGTNPVADVQMQGPVLAVERAVAHFLPPAREGRPALPTGLRGRLERRMASVLARHVGIEQVDGKGLAFGTAPGVYGYVAASPDAKARAHDTTPASVDLHNVGVDFLVSLAPLLAR
ncbi:hypothetical protein ACFU96_21315 [Streptomyces sp. NPDC057620]|uniref:hypothetical protein n=1 Tax=Streptomyces sp. NPDC057620 TaxID=3346185 RepID=UPI003690444F